MTELERIKKYIKNTNLNMNTNYNIRVGEMIAVGQCDFFHAIGLAFQYGQAKGYRAAKAEMKKKVEVR